MHNPKVEKAASEYLRRVDPSPTQPWKRSEVQRHLVAFAEEQRREVRAEVLAPREASPELDRAERILRDDAIEMSMEDAAVIAAELDHLRAALAASEARVRELTEQLHAAHEDDRRAMAYIAELEGQVEKLRAANLIRIHAADGRTELADELDRLGLGPTPKAVEP